MLVKSESSRQAEVQRELSCQGSHGKSGGARARAQASQPTLLHLLFHPQGYLPPSAGRALASGVLAMPHLWRAASHNTWSKARAQSLAGRGDGEPTMGLSHLAQIPGLSTGGGSSQWSWDTGRQDSTPARAGPSTLNGPSFPLRTGPYLGVDGP